MNMTPNTCPFCINVARDIALEGMIENILDDHDELEYDDAYALVNDTPNMWAYVNDIVSDWANDDRDLCDAMN